MKPFLYLLITFFLMTACCFPALAEEADGRVTEPDELSFPLGMAMRGGSFTGTAYIAPMIAYDSVYHFPQTNCITFEPGARSGWHTHGGMMILAVDGVGYYQEEGQPAQILRKGDVVACASGVRHWHGAAPDSWFSQIVIYDTNFSSAAGGETPVTDAEYESLDAVAYAGHVSHDPALTFAPAAQAMNSPTFSGPVYVSGLVDGNNAAGAPALHYVVFEPGIVNNWHTHEGGQILIATDGVGFHQIEGEPVQVLYPGDVAYCPPGVKHWHGGSLNGTFAHIAANTNPDRPGVQWFDRISEEELAAIEAEIQDNGRE